jgi:hypothetical protein
MMIAFHDEAKNRYASAFLERIWTKDKHRF